MHDLSANKQKPLTEISVNRGNSSMTQLGNDFQMIK